MLDVQIPLLRKGLKQMERNGTTTASLLGQLSDELADAVERAASSTVTVHARRRMPATGIVWSPDGLIVSANHVVERSDDITIGLPDGRSVDATLVGRDPGTDLAVLRVDASDLIPAPRSDSAPRPGNLVLAIGRPGPSGPMASLGVIGLVGGSWRTQGGNRVEGFLRSDVAMLPGFSGGPLIDVAGDVLGLNSSTLGRGGGLTVPAEVIDRISAALQSDGRIRRGFLGIGAQSVALNARLADGLGLEQERGLVVVSLEPDGPAERDGILLGDVIVSVADSPVGSVEELQDRLSGDLVGKRTSLKLIRGGELKEQEVTVGERS
jgi:S1-C subfamily serine protease